MTEHSAQVKLHQLVERYLGLESFEVTEELLDLCGASIDACALPLLKRRLHEEEVQIPMLEARGYIRIVNSANIRRFLARNIGNWRET